MSWNDATRRVDLHDGRRARRRGVDGRQRVWAQPVRIKIFIAITLEQPIGELLLIRARGPAILHRARVASGTARAASSR